jgi:hypothetical protein
VPNAHGPARAADDPSTAWNAEPYAPRILRRDARSLTREDERSTANFWLALGAGIAAALAADVLARRVKRRR